MSVGTIVLIILVIALLGGFSGLGGGPFYGTGLPQQSADLRDGSWLASAHGECIESIIGVQRFGAPDARHRLRDEERAIGRQRSAHGPQ